MLTPDSPGNWPTLLKSAPVGVDWLRRLTWAEALAVRLGQADAAATSRWARAWAIRSTASLASRFAEAARVISEASAGSLKAVHQAPSAGAVVTRSG